MTTETEPAYHLKEGDSYEGFLVVRRIGCGGFGQVYLVRDERGRRWALKLWVPTEAKDAPARARNKVAAQRFLLEAAILQSIKNMHVVRCERHGQAADGSLWLLLEYLPGNHLRREIALCELGRMPMERVLRLGYQIASALFVIHGRGVVHRDIKPENVMILPGDIAKVLDFGVAKAQGASASFRTTGAVHYGTGLYMAPDRLMSRGGESSPAWDIYSTGLMLWEAADGEHPFFKKAGAQLTDAQVIHMHMGGHDIPSLAEVTGHDEEVCAAIMKACAPDPQQRYASAEAMMDAFEVALQRERDLSVDRVNVLGQNVTGRTRARITSAITEPSLGPGPAEAAPAPSSPAAASPAAPAAAAPAAPVAPVAHAVSEVPVVAGGRWPKTERITVPPAVVRSPPIAGEARRASVAASRTERIGPDSPSASGVRLQASGARPSAARAAPPALVPRVAPPPAPNVLRELGRPGWTEAERSAVAALEPDEHLYRVLFLRYLDTLPPEVAIDMDAIGDAIAAYLDLLDATQPAAASVAAAPAEEAAVVGAVDPPRRAPGLRVPQRSVLARVRSAADRVADRVPVAMAVALMVLTTVVLVVTFAGSRIRAAVMRASEPEGPITLPIEPAPPWTAPPVQEAPPQPEAPPDGPSAGPIGPGVAVAPGSSGSGSAAPASAPPAAPKPKPWAPAKPAPTLRPGLYGDDEFGGTPKPTAPASTHKPPPKLPSNARPRPPPGTAPQ